MDLRACLLIMETVESAGKPGEFRYLPYRLWYGRIIVQPNYALFLM